MKMISAFVLAFAFVGLFAMNAQAQVCVGPLCFGQQQRGGYGYDDPYRRRGYGYDEQYRRRGYDDRYRRGPPDRYRNDRRW